MHRQVKNGNDTLAGLRISAYKAAFNYGSANTARRHLHHDRDPDQPRSAKALFQMLYTSANANEQQMLISLAGKKRISYDPWLKELDIAPESEHAKKR